MAITMLWLELTGKCQLECVHCYAGSGPGGGHGTMTNSEWFDVIDQAAAAGVEMVQFIGGEPTLHPALPMLIGHALDAGLQVEVFSNLVRVSPQLWESFSRPGVQLATSWYSDDPLEHRRITGRPTHARTKANIAEAVARSIPLRVGVVAMSAGQRVEQARTELTALGVTHIGVDTLRQVGRGARDPEPGNTAGQLCGRCGNGVAAISPDGRVWPCIMSRWMTVGTVRTGQLAELCTEPLAAARRELFPAGTPVEACVPVCEPSCSPKSLCGPTCGPNYCGP